MKIFSLIYFSKAIRPMAKADLLSILELSRSWNESHAISGMLIYLEGNPELADSDRFMQVLEGAEKDIRDLFTKIQADPRHRQVRLLHEMTTDSRNFADWSMGFQSLTPDAHEAHPAYFELNDRFLLLAPGERFNFALTFLQSFYQLRVL